MGPHELIRESLSDYRDGALEDAARVQLERHLESCADCRRDLAGLERAARAFFAAPQASLPEDFSRRVMAEVAGRTMAETVSWVAAALDGWAAPALALGLAVAAAVAVLPEPETDTAQVAAATLSADGGFADWAAGDDQAGELVAAVNEDP